MANRIQIRRDIAANWTSANPTLAQGEIGFETDTKKVKIGDGSTAWTSLTYVIESGNYATLDGVQTLTNKTINGSNNTITNVSLSTGVTGTLPVGNGGTGAATLTGYVKGNGTSAMTASGTIPNTDISGLGTMSTQAANNVNITGGSVTGITDLAVADGGTGASNASGARVNLLPSYTGNGGKVLAVNTGATDVEWITSSGYSDADVDTHLNTSTATTGQVLSWDGADYDWITPAGGSSTLTIDNKTGAYTVVAGDLGKIINCTANTFTVSLTAAATLGAGFNVTIWNTGTGTITIDPSGSETIDSLSNVVLQRAQGLQLVCNGSGWNSNYSKQKGSHAQNINPADASPVVTGVRTIALGTTSTTASGFASVAIGKGTASGTNSLILGDTDTLRTASGDNSTAIGANSAAQGSQAVTGAGAMALGGSYASGTDSFAAAVANNTSSYGAKAANSIAMGNTAIASEMGAIALGFGSASSGTYSVCIGGSNSWPSVANQRASVALGEAANSVIAGKFAFSGTASFGRGGAQTGTLNLIATTTNNTATVLRSNTSAAGTTNQVILPNNSAFAFSGLIVARQQAADGTASAAWKVEGLIRREANAGTTTLVASTVTAIDNTPSWTLALSADTTNGGLKVEATGAAATDINWVATIQTSEVIYA